MALCSYCGVQWFRSQLTRDASQNLACPDCAPGLDIVSLTEGNARMMRSQAPRSVGPSDGNFDQFICPPSPGFVNPNGPPKIVPSSLGYVATRLAVPDSSQANTQPWMVRTGHIATDSMSLIRLAWANWYAHEQIPGANMLTLTASVEYPAGVFTRVKFRGGETGSASAGSTLWSDDLPVNIPLGARFWTRAFFRNSSNLLALGPSLCNALFGDAIVQNGTDQTMGGTIVSNANFLMPPCAIVGATSKRSVVIIGDSRTAGVGDNFQAANGGWGEMRSGLAQYAGVNCGISGTSAAQYLASAGPLRAELIGYCTDVVDAYGVNDIFVFGRSNAQLKADQAAIRALYPTKRFFVTTLDPETTSTDNWATLVNQTPRAQEAVRVAYNTDVRANALGSTGFFECAAVSESSLNSGLFKVDGTAFKYTADGTHQSSFCYRLYSFALP